MRMLRLLFVFLASTLVTLPARAELPPSAYEQMQASAPEFVKIEVLRVDVEPGEDPTQQKIHIVAMVSAVSRSASGLKADDLINIVYSITERPKGWAGPGQVPVPVVKDQTVAYLKKLENGDYAPAAGRMTYSQF